MNHRNPKRWSVDGTEVIAKSASEARRKADKPHAIVTKVLGLVGTEKPSEAVSEPPDVPTSGQSEKPVSKRKSSKSKKKSNEQTGLFDSLGL